MLASVRDFLPQTRLGVVCGSYYGSICLYSGKFLIYIQYRQHYIKTAIAESQEGRFFPADGYQAIVNKLNKKSKTNRKWMDIEKQAAF